MKHYIILILSVSLLLIFNSCKRSDHVEHSVIVKENTKTGESVEFITITNSNSTSHTGKPRDKNLVKKELDQCMNLALYIEKYTKTNGLEKTIAEINKGRDGELSPFMSDDHFYLSFSENIIGESIRTIIAHATLPSAVGFAIPELSMIKDNTGWSYNGEMQEVLESQDSIKSGIIEELVWTDPSWSANSCRMTAHYTLFYYDNKEYNLYHAVWLDE